MLPGPTLVVKCGSCGGLLKCATIASGNTFDARFWTDGKICAPMMPDQPALVKCPYCETLLWIDEQEEVGEVDPGEEDDRFGECRPLVRPGAADYAAFLEGEISDPDKEAYLRMRAWWAGNDGRREDAGTQRLSEREVANLQVLANLLDESDDYQRVLKAEAMRELGLFDKAVSLLDSPLGDDVCEAAATIKELAAEQDPFVADVPT